MTIYTTDNIRFNYYPANNKITKPLGMVSLDQFFEAIRRPKREIIGIFKRIRQAELDGNKELKTELKSKLYSFTPCVIVKDRRAYDFIESFTGLMVLDFDKLNPDYAVRFKNFLYDEYPFIIATWLSASGCGVRALVKIPVVSSIVEFKALFKGLQYLEMGQYNGFDIAPQNSVLPLYLSYDPEILLRDTSEVWETPYSPPIKMPLTQYKIHNKFERIERIMKSAIDKIIDNGHPQVLAASYSLGGYVGAGYIDRQSAVELLHSLIESNNYLSKGTEGYKKSAKTMIEKGSSSPLYLK